MTSQYNQAASGIRCSLPQKGAAVSWHEILMNHQDSAV
jgi:hypothetical protein